MSDLSALEGRIRALEDIEAIRALKWDYANLADRGWALAGADYEGWPALFTADATYDTNGGTPTFTDRASLAQWNSELGETSAFSFHLVGNGQIRVDGDTAVGRWHALMAVTDPDATQAGWTAGVFDDQFVRTHEGWRISSLTFRLAFYTPYEGAGWIK